MKIQFLGAAQTVTGSKYLISTGQTHLLVDCGLYQGLKALRLRNWNPLPIDPSKIDYVILTHAHIDHSGYIPLLVKNGFNGKIFCTEATRELCSILLPDSGHLQEEEARFANRHGYSKHHPALPLYTKKEAEAALSYFYPLPFGKKFDINSQLSFTFYYAGHILGASLVRLSDKKTSLLFSGDLGRSNDPIMRPPKNPPQSDYLVIESTYGNRLHEKENPEDQLAEIINRTIKRGGIVLIPSFAVGRAQNILYYLYQLKKKNRIPDIPVYMDSPMATNATRIFWEFSDQHRLSAKESEAVCQTAHYIHTIEESKKLDEKIMPMIIISASGMATGGRVLHHIKLFAPDHRNTIIFSGYQAELTRGDRMVRGESEVKMFGEMVPIRCEIIQLENTSAHADYTEMLAWLKHLKKPPKKVFITHGESEAAAALKAKIIQEFKWPCLTPEYLYTEELL